MITGPDEDVPLRPEEAGDRSAGVLLVDAANVVGSRPDGWWKDRPGAAGRFVDAVRAAAAAGRLTRPVVVVLEGDARRGAVAGTEDGVRVVHAPRGGDDLLVELAVGAVGHPVLVSSDRALRRRVEQVGGTTLGSRWLLARL